jgi:hypothetical protein
MIEITTPALLFPAVSLLFLAYTNRFLHLAALIRTLHSGWVEHREPALRAQIDNLRHRLVLIRWMQLLGATSLLLCVLSMVAIIWNHHSVALIAFAAALILMTLSLAALIVEIFLSGGALRILLNEVEEDKGGKNRKNEAQIRS